MRKRGIAIASVLLILSHCLLSGCGSLAVPEARELLWYQQNLFSGELHVAENGEDAVYHLKSEGGVRRYTVRGSGATTGVVYTFGADGTETVAAGETSVTVPPNRNAGIGKTDAMLFGLCADGAAVSPAADAYRMICGGVEVLFDRESRLPVTLKQGNTVITVSCQTE